MANTSRHVPKALALLTVLAIGGCTLRSHLLTKHLEEIRLGDTEALVLSKLGEPGRKELPGTPYFRYASSPCSNPCVERLWWDGEFMDIEAWSVSLDANHKVVDTTHWVSP
jgi:hypothetical protein